jgi:hypothetical protein
MNVRGMVATLGDNMERNSSVTGSDSTAQTSTTKAGTKDGSAQQPWMLAAPQADDAAAENLPPDLAAQSEELRAMLGITTGARKSNLVDETGTKACPDHTGVLPVNLEVMALLSSLTRSALEKGLNGLFEQMAGLTKKLVLQLGEQQPRDIGMFPLRLGPYLLETTKLLLAGNQLLALRRFEVGLREYGQPSIDVNALVQWVLREAYLEQLKNLQFQAALDTHMRNMEEKLNSVGDDAQLANVDLQNTLQKQQQLIQMLSNVSKLLSDTALSVIRKIGG